MIKHLQCLVFRYQNINLLHKISSLLQGFMHIDSELLTRKLPGQKLKIHQSVHLPCEWDLVSNVSLLQRKRSGCVTLDKTCVCVVHKCVCQLWLHHNIDQGHSCTIAALIGCQFLSVAWPKHDTFSRS